MTNKRILLLFAIVDAVLLTVALIAVAAKHYHASVPDRFLEQLDRDWKP